MEVAHLQHQAQERILREEQLRVKEDLRQLSLRQQLTIDKIKMEHLQEMSALRKNIEQESRELEIKFQNQTDTLRNELEKRRRNDLQETDIKDQQHLAILKKNHEKAIIDLKNYFNDIILNNMTLITSMKVLVTQLAGFKLQIKFRLFDLNKEQLAEYRVKEERLERQYQSTNRDVKALRERCERLENMNKELQKDTESWQHAKTSLQVSFLSFNLLLKKADWQ